MKKRLVLRLPMSGKTAVADARPRLIDGQNRVILPAEALASLGAEAGDYVAFLVEGREVRLVKVKWVTDRGGEMDDKKIRLSRGLA